MTVDIPELVAVLCVVFPFGSVRYSYYGNVTHHLILTSVPIPEIVSTLRFAIINLHDHTRSVPPVEPNDDADVKVTKVLCISCGCNLYKLNHVIYWGPVVLPPANNARVGDAVAEESCSA